ncbi:MAG TPA: HupE/UreJ family protein, partial [Polyangiaceae bacterium]|nr:HupE/UreJ family protein [Polyangiaceae bacterium]
MNGRALGARLWLVVLCSFWLCWPEAAFAHDVRPAFLQLTQTGPTRYEVIWKRPLRGDASAPLAPVFPDDCHAVASHTRALEGALIETSFVECQATLSARSLRIDGLRRTRMDALVQVQLTDGTTESSLLRGSQDSFVVASAPSAFGVAGSYVVLGIEHILLGFDHLLFVLGLLWIVRGSGRLVVAITSFTAAHSLTLALASLGIIH